MPKRIHVVGAVITRDGLVMCAQRGDDGNLPGLWEFPGGKIEPGESKQAALMREITEELGCTVEVGREVTTTTHEYEFGEVTLTTFYCRLVAGTPKLTEHASIKWLRPDELESIPWAPADIPAIALIRADLI
ncbi:MAG: (deoxy)nucleoside triphosphate pyrophosphohydrolase [Actinobacteria bacterium]|nr:(deoxy)nucleoside triphosphate pyrophosphohydrolase [Actinomycetota bacterium]